MERWFIRIATVAFLSGGCITVFLENHSFSLLFALGALAVGIACAAFNDVVVGSVMGWATYGHQD